MWPSFVPYLWEVFAYRARAMVHPRLAKGWGPRVYRKLKHRHREGPRLLGSYPELSRLVPSWQLFIFQRRPRRVWNQKRKKMVYELKG